MKTVAQKAGTAHFTVDAGPVLDPDLKKMSTALNVIAGYALTQRRLMMMLSGREVDKQFEDDVMQAVEILSTTIGSLADELSGDNIHSSSQRWHFGPAFEKAPGGAA